VNQASGSAIQLRKYKPTDLPRVLEIEASAFSPTFTYPRRQFQELHRKYSDGFLVAELPEKGVIGYVIGYVSEGAGELDSVAIDPAFEGLGAGKKLLLTTLDSFRNHGAKKATLEVHTLNARAMHFFQKLGFKTIGTVPSFYAIGVDAYRMQLEL